jgi:hypothetical protein
MLNLPAFAFAQVCRIADSLRHGDELPMCGL